MTSLILLLITGCFQKFKKRLIIFASETLFPKLLHQCVVYKFQCGLWNEFYCGKCFSSLAMRSGKQNGISPLSNKKEQPRKNNGICHHLLNNNKINVWSKNLSCLF